MLRLHLRKNFEMPKNEQYPEEFVKFLNASPTPFHVVQNMKNHLLHHGFQELKEEKPWSGNLSRGGAYFVTRNDSAIIAFVLGQDYVDGNPFAIVGAHTDSPVLKIKPISKRNNEKYDQIGVECYGGGIWHSWFDSDLSVAGRVVYRNETNEGYQLLSKLVDLKRPLLKIPTLAIHLDRDVNQKFEFDKENQLLPIAGLEDKQLKKDASCASGEPEIDDFFSIKSVVERHHRDLVELVANELQITSDIIEDFELTLYDHKAACLGGLHDEFVFSGRLDNLTSCFTSLHALTASMQDDKEGKCVKVVASFDHEEIGSSSAQGADSNFLPSVLERLATLGFNDSTLSKPLTEAEKLKVATRKSFFLSSDVAHAVHPNYANKYESKHKPMIGGGPVIKINANQRYMTNSPGLVLIKSLANLSKVPLQLFVVANNSPCGSTIGPIIASKTGIQTLDLGNPILSMHSIRETGGAEDLGWQIDLFREFFGQGTKILETGFVNRKN
ncbi:LANO_0H22518g1_1 [Lachancea nothofagi CBS 11611]|uniref:aspartyl aminopeptidase n=1 Tax=Lachancea nothofagi CBS 11611 TaxID=1266666 RepID=A0A1G4KNQ6_9SACH|nr:LANO_0H22518g1_1 [Lachancea nothofagi CBS 11611]